uniref:NADH dehydrogenase subunit 3 n=1 Tax=Euurobracon yokahamae TaxID=2911681 RepID=UPI00207AF24B|nr:NADH dehydrogenase subunit 3 [Euurobracon yokahamae]UJJ81889.1 NADH dehydrogenase subunit 3 [Euurobracon yokahamae]
MLIFLLMLIFLISLFLLILNLFLSKKEYMDREKMSSFECGFSSLVSSRLPFSIHFYLIGILFLIFDLEIVFLFPMLVLLEKLLLYEWLYLSLMIFLILFYGLEYEKMEGSLKWIF